MESTEHRDQNRPDENRDDENESQGRGPNGAGSPEIDAPVDGPAPQGGGDDPGATSQDRPAS
ncbi:MAG: hypothetical protein QOG54_1881 [Actinomycetota bacterium]|jgi:hypothetical protein|nr:hypothetical protein [Actinomycetota bacterium]